MSVQTITPLVSIQPTVLSTATYTRTPASARAPYPAFSLQAPASESVHTAHRVAPGENLTRIVREFLVAQGRNPAPAEVYEGVKTIARANSLRNADLIHPGQTLDLSALLDGGQAPPAGASAASLPAEFPRTPVPEALLAPPAPLIQVSPLEDTTTDTAPRVAPSAAPTDPLIGTGLTQTGAPVRMAARLVTDLLPAAASRPSGAHHPHGAAGGPGPMPSDAALALQRVLNKTSNALSVLRGLVAHEPGSGDAPHGPWAPILKGRARISSEYGMRKDPFNGRMAFHDGLDLAVKRGTEITALRDGVVTRSGWQGGYGNTVVLRHEDGVETVYGHTARTHVTEGQTVKAGTVIADAGSTGRSTGPHLHFEVRQNGQAVNPLPYLKDSNLQRAPGGPGH